MDHWTFIAASIALLATPGPTNTLLATSGAAVGVRRSLPLLGAELAGYLGSIATLTILVGPAIGATPAVGVALRVAVALYLVHLAARLWRHGAAELDAGAPVTFARVLVTTLLNPKGLLFAFAILPQGVGLPALLPWLAGLAMLILAIGGGWLCVGAALRAGVSGHVPPRLGYRLSALALLALAGMVAGPVVG